MRVLIIHRDLGVGSVGKIVEDLYFGIKSSGCECKVAFGGTVNKSRIPLEDIYSVNTAFEMKINAILTRFTDRDGFYSKHKTEKLICYIREYEPDIIHIHGCYGYWINIKVLYKFLSTTKIRIINTLHSCWDFTGHCCYFTRSKCKKWHDCCYKCPEKKSYPKSYFLDQSKKNYLQKKALLTSVNNMEFVSPSRWLADCFKESFLKNYKISVINNGIDTDSFKKTSIDLTCYGIDINKKIILGVASIWDSRKGLEDFIELSNLLSEDYQIVLVGLNDKQIKKVNKGIICIKKTNNKKELAAIYSAASVFFNPTYEDNYPTVNLESIACGTPVVTYNTGGSPEAIIEYNYGKIIDYKDYKSLIEYINYVHSNDISSEKNTDNLSRKIMIENYLKLYNDCI